MVRRTLALAALASVAMSMGGVAQAMAAPIGSIVAVSPNQSDSNLRWARHRLEENIDMLNNDRNDYGGFRARAIRLFQQAREQLTLGLRFDNRNYAPIGVRPYADDFSTRGQRGSDMNLRSVRRNVERIMDVLQHDNNDYGGHRATALRLLAEGRNMLTDGIRYDAHH